VVLKNQGFYQDVKERLPRVELSLPRERRVGLYTMVFENMSKCVQMIKNSAPQGAGAVEVVTIFEKMELFWALCSAWVAVCHERLV
jgi:hypothetical protein